LFLYSTRTVYFRLLKWEQNPVFYSAINYKTYSTAVQFRHRSFTKGILVYLTISTIRKTHELFRIPWPILKTALVINSTHKLHVTFAETNLILFATSLRQFKILEIAVSNTYHCMLHIPQIHVFDKLWHHVNYTSHFELHHSLTSLSTSTGHCAAIFLLSHLAVRCGKWVR
jgi:hypothetical protein